METRTGKEGGSWVRDKPGMCLVPRTKNHRYSSGYAPRNLKDGVKILEDLYQVIGNLLRNQTEKWHKANEKNTESLGKHISERRIPKLPKGGAR